MGVAGSHRVKDAWKLEGQQLAHQQREGGCREGRVGMLCAYVYV
jgi:hypothetical protein